MANLIRVKQLDQPDLSGFFNTAFVNTGILDATFVDKFTDQNISGVKTFIDGVNLNNIDNLSLSGVDISIINANIALTNRPTVNGTGVLLSGEAAAAINLPTTIVYTTGDQTISGVKTFARRPTVNGTGILLSGEATVLPTTIVYTTGDQAISGVKTFVEGINLNNIQNLILSGLDITITSGDVILTNRPTVNGTGVLLSGEIASLPTTIVYTTGNQNISGTKTFNSPIYFRSGINTAGYSNVNTSGGYIDLRGGGGGRGGNIISIGASTDVDNVSDGGSINLSAGLTDASPGGSITMIGGSEAVSPAGSIDTCGGRGNTAGIYAPGGNIYTRGGNNYSRGGNINTSAGNNYYSRGGDILTYGGVNTEDYALGGDILTYGGFYGSGGCLNLSNNSGASLLIQTGHLGSQSNGSIYSKINDNLYIRKNSVWEKVITDKQNPVYATGDQTISGIKTFATGVNISGHVSIGINNDKFGLYVRKSPAGVTVNPDSNSIAVFEGSGNSHITVLASNAQTAGVVLGSPADNFGSYLTWNHDNNALKLGTDKPSGFIQILTDDERVAITITSGGNVGINNLTPSEKLEVNGNVKVSGNLTVNNTGVLLSGQNSFIINLYNVSDTQNAGNNFFGNIAAVFSSTAGGVNRRFPVLEACVVKRATWTQFVQTTGVPSLNSTGYFINTTTSKTGIISTTINTQSTSTPTHYIAEFSPPIVISTGDYIVCNLFGPTYATTFPATARNSVNLYCYN